MEDLKQGTRIEFNVYGVKSKGTIMGIQQLDPMLGSSTHGELKMDKYYIVQLDKPIDKVYEYDYQCLLIKEEDINLIDEFELNNHGLKVWKHKTNKHLFLEQSYRWVDNLVLLDETDGRQVIDSFKASTFNYGAWEPMTQDEYDRIEKKYKEIYDVKPITKDAKVKEKMYTKEDVIGYIGGFVDYFLREYKLYEKLKKAPCLHNLATTWMEESIRIANIKNKNRKQNS